MQATTRNVLLAQVVPTKGHTLPAAHHTNSQKALPLKHLLSISWEPCNSAYAVQGMPATTM